MDVEAKLVEVVQPLVPRIAAEDEQGVLVRHHGMEVARGGFLE